jgi:predicted N-formylglutamate amidohydrolase
MNEIAGPRPREPLLGPEDPPPFTHLNPGGRARVVLLCDHASRAVPRRLGTLGLEEAELARHIGWDIGAAEVTRHLSRRLDAQAFLSGYSRLVVDCNRKLDEPSAAPAVSDRTVVPANQCLAPEDIAWRAEAVYWPYQRAIAAALDAFEAKGIAPAVVSIHSFTPVFDAMHRPWHIGILWHRDDRLAKPLLGSLAADPAIAVGDNEPYTGGSPHAYTIPTHGLARGLPHVQFEIRQDLIADADGAERWANRIHRALAAVLADDGLYRVRRS